MPRRGLRLTPLGLACLLVAWLGVGCEGCTTDTDDDDTVVTDDDDSVVADDDDVVDDDDAVDDDDSGPGDCAPDFWEDNDDLEHAAQTSECEEPSCGQGLTACHGDADWYAIEVPPDSWLYVGAVFEHAEGDIDLRLHELGGALLDESTSQDDDELVADFFPAGGEAAFEVRLASDSGVVDGNTYDLALSVCRLDELEPNDEEATATTVVETVSWFDLSVCGTAQEDWFYFPDRIWSDGIEARVSSAPEWVELDMYLFGPDGGLVASATNSGGTEWLFHSVIEEGDYNLQIVVADDPGTPGGSYDLHINLETVPYQDCHPDSYEPDDDMGLATPITAAWYEDFTICEGDDDYFQIAAAAGDSIDLTLDCFDWEGDIGLFLLDETGAELASSEGQPDDEFLSYDVQADGTLFVRTTLSNDEGIFPGNVYGLILEGASSVCIDDVFEPNDSPTSALGVDNGDFWNQTICPTDDDWYALDLGQLEELMINVGYDASEGNVDAFLLDPAMDVVAEGTSVDDDELFFFTVQEQGTYLLRITLQQEAGSLAGNIYDFGVLSVVTGVCSPDDYEPNDSAAQATVISHGSYPGATVCELEPDFFGFAVAAAETIDLEVLFDDVEGDIRMALHDPWGTVVASGTSTATGETLVYEATAAGTWAVEVWMAADAGMVTGNSFELVFTAVP